MEPAALNSHALEPPALESDGGGRGLLLGLLAALLGAGLGAALMFLLDPISGRRRRSALRTRATAVRGSGKSGTLEARVRARLGEVAANPAAIDVAAEAGRVTLRGVVLPEELEDVLDEVSAIDGVREVHNLLQVQWATPYVPGRH